MNASRTWLLAAIIVLPLSMPFAAAADGPSIMPDEHMAMTRTIRAITAGADCGEEARVRAVFPDRVTLDYSSHYMLIGAFDPTFAVKA